MGTDDFSESGKWRPRNHLKIATREVEKSTVCLQKAGDNTSKKRGYQSASTRATFHVEFCCLNPGKVPYSWQVDDGEAQHKLGLDYLVIAGTGTGKTMPFVMPLFLDPKKIVVVISPLNALEEDQVNTCHHLSRIFIS